jgi:hypothetical protein
VGAQVMADLEEERQRSSGPRWKRVFRRRR